VAKRREEEMAREKKYGTAGEVYKLYEVG